MFDIQIAVKRYEVIFRLLFLLFLAPTTEQLKALNSLAANPALSLEKFSSCCSPSQQRQNFSVTLKLSL